MNLLLDTHALLWALADPDELSVRARSLIVDPKSVVFASAVSAWEIAIKKRLGKLKAPDDLLEQLEAHRFTTLDIRFSHALAVESLPGIHDDPFDRLLVAQAQIERLTLVTRDTRIRRYRIAHIVA